MFPNVSKYDSRIQLNISATFQAVIIVQLSSTDSFVHVLQAQGNQLKINVCSVILRGTRESVEDK
jgi:hypothetical protein